MEKAKAAENQTAYDHFLERLDKTMREALGMAPKPSEVDEPQGSTADEKPSE